MIDTLLGCAYLINLLADFPARRFYVMRGTCLSFENRTYHLMFIKQSTN